MPCLRNSCYGAAQSGGDEDNQDYDRSPSAARV
jgi:hypothetical protein